jgi:hypothetical protein
MTSTSATASGASRHSLAPLTPDVRVPDYLGEPTVPEAMSIPRASVASRIVAALAVLTACRGDWDGRGIVRVAGAWVLAVQKFAAGSTPPSSPPGANGRSIEDHMLFGK